jgi:hypothetical protein
MSGEGLYRFAYGAGEIRVVSSQPRQNLACRPGETLVDRIGSSIVSP